MSRFFRSSFLFFSFTHLALAQSRPADAGPELHLSPMIVSAGASPREQADLAQATSLLTGDELTRRQAATLGETLSGLPGVSSTYFGPGASRPIIRGLGGDRVRILENSVGTLDASVLSPDHAVSIEPFLVERVEVVRGPASLLYGTSAVGGVVNVLTHRIERELPAKDWRGLVTARYGSGADERAWGGVTDLALRRSATSALVVHLDGYARRIGDLAIPGFAESDMRRADETAAALAAGEPAPVFARRTLPNSSVRSSGGAAALSWVGTDWHAGASWSGFDTRYGVPDGENVQIDLKQRRLDCEGEIMRPIGPFSGARLKFGRAHYTHRELDGEVVGTIFNTDGYEARAELLHTHVEGLAGTWGVQAGDSQVEALGDEAFLPPTHATNRAAFVYEEHPFGPVTVEFGGRYERAELRAEDGSGRRRRDDTTSWSGGLVWNATSAWTLAGTLVGTERAPNAQETFAFGPHAGTNAFEIGDATLARERSLGTEVSLRRRTGRVTGELTVFANRFAGFIHEEATGAEEEGMPVYRFVQTDARFRGAEAEVVWHWHEAAGERFDVKLGADYTRAEDAAGVSLPRIPAQRTTLAFEWAKGKWSAGAEWQLTAKQTRVAANEASSEGYNLASVHLAWHLTDTHGAWEVFLRGTNLGDVEARPHTSFLRDLAPLPGRSVTVGAQFEF